MHDTYAACIGTLLPVLIERLGIPIGSAGVLASGFRLPSMLQPFLGYWADRYDARKLVVWTPTVTALLISSIGLANDYLATFALLIAAGLSGAAFHPAAGALVTRVGGSRWGRATSYFQTGGELGRAAGPIVIASALAYLTVEQLWVLAAPALGLSLFAHSRVAGDDARIARPPPPAALRAAIVARRRPLALMTLIVSLRALTVAGMMTYLVTLLTIEGWALATAAAALMIYEIGGVAGAFLGGTLSDRLGRRTLMLASQIAAGPTLFAALWFSSDARLLFGLLLIGGFLVLYAGGVQLALMQELLPGNRSVAVGITYFLSYESGLLAVLLLGFAADLFGLRAALLGGLAASMLSLPFTFLIPETRRV